MTDFCLERPLPSNCLKQYAGMAFDGCQYYLPVRDEKSVFVLDSSLQPQEHIETCRSYSAICYDPDENCFWAASRGCAAVLFQLTSCLEEIDRITVNTGCWGNPDITGISCCTPGGALLLSVGNAVLCLDKHSGCSTVLFKETGPAMITGVVCASPLVLYYVYRDCVQTLVVKDETGVTLEKFATRQDYWIRSAVLAPCVDCSGAYHLFQLAEKHACYPYILDLNLGDCISARICPCNQLLCDRFCHPEKCREQCRRQACNDVLESIALQEASLAHILNAEGDKLQKTIAISADPCTMLRANESVRKTMMSAVQLEQLLYAKLDALNEQCPICEEESCPACCGPNPTCFSGVFCNDSP